MFIKAGFLLRPRMATITVPQAYTSDVGFAIGIKSGKSRRRIRNIFDRKIYNKGLFLLARPGSFRARQKSVS